MHRLTGIDFGRGELDKSTPALSVIKYQMGINGGVVGMTINW